jgi:hypothetical protein
MVSSRINSREGIKKSNRYFFSFGFQIKNINERKVKKIRKVSMVLLKASGRNEK